ncbi:hypothetical protein [Kitasatospora sp. NPDC051914]|uniref:hypothetical protein n=1 Tax=Kitasatospora sp. NPDC051914 TaxID=3154945 RepID=UPI00343D5D29
MADLQHPLAGGRQPVLDAAAVPGGALGQALGDEAAGEGAEGLFGLEGLGGEGPHRGAGQPADGAQRVPPGEVAPTAAGRPP